MFGMKQLINVMQLNHTKLRAAVFCVALSVFAYVPLMHSVIITVTSTADDHNVSFPDPNPPTPVATNGQVTLRSAIEFSQGSQSGATNTIRFDIPQSDPGFINNHWIISPQIIAISNSAYRINAKPVIVNGYTFPGAVHNFATPNSNAFEDGSNANLTIEIRGPGASNLAIGFLVTNVNTCEFRGLCMTRFFGNGTNISGAAIRFNPSSNSVVAGNFFGIDHTGTQFIDPVSQLTLATARALLISATSLSIRVGGDLPEDSNVVAAGLTNVSMLTGPFTNGVIKRNYFGTDKFGENTSFVSIRMVRLTGTNVLVENNLFAGTAFPLALDSVNTPAAPTIIRNNKFGTNARGTRVVGNTSGISITTGTNSIVENNLFAGIEAGALKIGQRDNVAPNPVSNVTVRNNLFGTDITGKKVLGNGRSNIRVYFANNVLIENNVIAAACEDGIRVTESSSQVIIRSNIIGGDSTGTKSRDKCGKKFGNRLNGVRVGIGQGATQNTTIGGQNPADGNVIVNNGENGILIDAGSSSTVVVNNSIGVGTNGSAQGNKKAAIKIKCSPEQLIGNNQIDNNGKDEVVVCNS